MARRWMVGNSWILAADTRESDAIGIMPLKVVRKRIGRKDEETLVKG